MKNLLTILVIFLGLGLANAQEKKALTLDETVTYINNMFKEYGTSITFHIPGNQYANYIHKIAVSKNGKLIFFRHLAGEDEKNMGSFNLFDFEKLELGENRIVRILDNNDKNIATIYGLSPSDSSKLEKAFKHLRTLCIKEEDPFD